MRHKPAGCIAFTISQGTQEMEGRLSNIDACAVFPLQICSHRSVPIRVSAWFQLVESELGGQSAKLQVTH